MVKLKQIFLSMLICSGSSCAAIKRGPDFMILGAMKAGTTSLYDYICQHPHVKSASRKEMHFFNPHRGRDNYINLGMRWYLEKFPRKKPGDTFLTGEATVTYLSDPKVANRVKKHFPLCKFIIMLRNPIDRAYSHYQHTVRSSGETRTFEECIACEITRGGPRKQQWLDLGTYIFQIKRWFKEFNYSQFLIINFDDLKLNPQETMHKVFKFLNLNPISSIDLTPKNKGDSYPPMNLETRQLLVEYFAPYNKMLEDYLGMKFDWN